MVTLGDQEWGKEQNVEDWMRGEAGNSNYEKCFKKFEWKEREDETVHIGSIRWGTKKSEVF